MTPPPDHALAAARVFDGETFLRDRTLLLRGGAIVDITAVPPPGVPVTRLSPEMILAPGFIDVQVNGGGGVLLNDNCGVEGIRRIVAAHRLGGTTGLLATLITDTRPAIAHAIEGVAAAIAAGVPGLLGIHLEGPFLSPRRIGIHDPARLARFGEGDAALLTGLGARGITLVTLAPEEVPPGAVAELVARGARVCAGHTADDGPAIRRALGEGLTGFTHLFNAMSQMGPRAPGAVGVALGEPDTFAGIIADGHHVGDLQLRLALRLMGRDRLMLVSDAMPPVGDDSDGFTLFGRRIRRDGDRLTGEDGTLAGAAITMVEAVRHMSGRGGATLEEALAMASLTPARFLGLDGRRGRIAPGFAADLVALTPDLTVTDTWIGGRAGTAAR